MTVAAAGSCVWFAALVIVPAPLAARILLLAPLVIVPALLPGALADGPARRRFHGAPVAWACLVAALPLPLAFSLSPGLTTAALTVPWMFVAGSAGMAAALHGLLALREPLDLQWLRARVDDAAIVYLAVGATFLAIDRLGVRLFDFPAVILLLTAVHFHIAGFGLLRVASVAGRRLGPAATGAAAALAVGMPLTAAGFTIDSAVLSWLGSLVVGGAGLVITVSLARLAGRSKGPRRAVIALAALALAPGMALALGWATATAVGTSLLDLDAMVRTHGALNGAGTLLASLAIADEGP